MSHCYVSDYQLELELREFLRSIDKDADTYDEYITLFMRSGLLNRRVSVHGGYWISVPNVGVFVKSLNAGRKRLAGVVKRRKRNEMLLWDLEKMKLPGLGMRYLVRDAIGSGMFQQVSCVCVCVVGWASYFKFSRLTFCFFVCLQIETTCGPLLRLCKKSS